MAWSHTIFCHSPLTSFIGYFSRRSPCTTSRAAAPLAQCAPRLIGESQDGCWPIHTPLATSAVTVQAHEQNVQTFLRMVTAAPAAAGGPACALRTLVRGNSPSEARLPATKPERRRKARRSRPAAEEAFANWARDRRWLECSLRLISMNASSFFHGIASEAVEPL